MTWSFMLLFEGQWPSCRHDGSPWQASDSSRSSKTGPLGFYACLLQLRGDWAWLKQVFGFPSWSGKDICWRCSAGQAHPWKDFSLAASW
eukprot:7126254-Alexandrium_andersonii.AAC.1